MSQKLVSFANYLEYKLIMAQKQKHRKLSPRTQSRSKDRRQTAFKKLESKPKMCETVTYDDVLKVHPALKASLGYCLYKSANLFRAQLDEKLKILEISVHHLALLSVISNEMTTNQNQMCEALGVDKASMVKLVDNIEKLKMVDRVTCSSDRRVKYLHITTIGLETLKKARKIRKLMEIDFLAPLSESDRTVLKRVLPLLLEQDKK
jgi:DNA-binding MarR family transcriptional regulator